MASRAEITARYAQAYVRASKGAKVRMLDEVVAVTGWSRDNARRRLVAAARPPGPGRTVAMTPRRQRAVKYSYDAVKVLQLVWAASGGQCGKYLAASMRLQLTALERHGELACGESRYDASVRAELLTMSAATIDRYLRGAKATDQLRGVATTKPSPLLRSSITIRKASDEVESEPGFFEGDTVAHCGPTLKGEFARTLNLTDFVTGWVFTRSMRNNANVHVLASLQAGVDAIPYAVTGLDFDNGSEFMNRPVIAWAAGRDICFTRSRPYRKNDQATIESKNNHLVRKYGFYYRYDTPGELATLNRLWKLVNDRMNYLTPTKKPTGWSQDRHGHRVRVYDTPATPLDRLLAAGVLATTQAAELEAYRDTLNPARIGREIADLQRALMKAAADKTDALYLANLPKPPLETRRHIRTRAS